MVQHKQSSEESIGTEVDDQSTILVNPHAGWEQGAWRERKGYQVLKKAICRKEISGNSIVDIEPKSVLNKIMTEKLSKNT